MIPLEPLHLRGGQGSAGGGAAGRCVGEPIDRRLADQRVHARLLVKGEQFAGGLVAVGGRG